MVSKESVLDKRYGAVIYATLHFAQVATVGLIITVGSIQIEAFCSSAASQPIRNVAWGPLLSAACLSGGRDTAATRSGMAPVAAGLSLVRPSFLPSSSSSSIHFLSLSRPYLIAIADRNRDTLLYGSRYTATRPMGRCIPKI